MKPSRKKSRFSRVRRIRAKISGTKECPRFSVYKSLKAIYVQVIDDVAGKTLVSARLSEIKAKNDAKGAEKLGELAAQKCQQAKIKKVVFDRGGYLYHGKVKALAEGARKGGLEF